MKMPVFDVLIEGKPRKVELTRETENSFSATTDDKRTTVKLPSARVDKVFDTIEIAGKTYRVEISSVERDKPVQVRVEGTVFEAEVKGYPARRPVLEFPTAKSSTLSQQRKTPLKQALVEGAVVAPMTGKIVSVRVKKGDQVKANQVVCVIEAMKMENEILSIIDGTVQEINVKEGSPVNEGEVLFIIT